MFGGFLYDNDERDNSPLGICRCQVATWKWETIDVDGFSYRNDNNAVLTSDEKNVIIVGTLNGEFGYFGIFILNIQDYDNYELRLSIRLQAADYGFRTPYPVVMGQRDINVILLTSGWFRESLSSKQQEPFLCPLDILKLIEKFVCQDTLHLISEYSGSGVLKHVTVTMTDILASDSEEMPPPRELPGPGLLHGDAWNEVIPIDNLPFTKTQFRICLCFLLVAYFCRIYMDW